MCGFNDDIDIEDIAWAFGFVEEEIIGERDEDASADPSPEDTLKTDLDYLDEA